jgi:hypothetical protein
MPETSAATTSESAPKRTDSYAIWPVVVREMEGHLSGAPGWLVERLKRDMEAREAHGREKSGVALQVDNGRDAGVDAYEAALDLCAYSRQQASRTKGGPWYAMHSQAVELAASMAYQLALAEGNEDR